MHSCKSTLSRNIPRALLRQRTASTPANIKAINSIIRPVSSTTTTTTPATMSLFQRFPYAEDASFTPLFRLLDDFDTYSRAGGRTGGASGSRSAAPSFSPKFDVRETENTYELHGELPGIDRKDVSIEFTEPQTIVVRGRVERNYTSGTPPAGLVEGAAPQASGALPAASESHHHASVSDEETEAAREKGVVSAKKTEKEHAQQKQQQQQQPAERYWHQERSIGEFQRAFSFPTRVNEAGVSASLKDGILHVSVPKAIKHEKRSIAIN
ncbi:uncharacterized protein E0L32_003122 [Thyridium curvatum]|uniref:SHSP domain-containing protein n=1 Tax=Thyridium curvatum TaxID=1093900 RepID=A0A507BJ68_9PEZI|nr:uncharacterized protein E0L32_003122 [Thyridium curvatum]TPX17479.1 hypothetical protein E0L32_003122 [Thyridium curvatum]